MVFTIDMHHHRRRRRTRLSARVDVHGYCKFTVLGYFRFEEGSQNEKCDLPALKIGRPIKVTEI